MSELLSGGEFEIFRDADGNKLSSINRDGTFDTNGINFADGSSLITAPVLASLKYFERTLSSAEVLSLGTAIDLITPAVNGVILPISPLVLSYKAGTTPYATATVLHLGPKVQINNNFEFTEIIISGGFIDASTDQLVWGPPSNWGTLTVGTSADVVGQPLQVVTTAGGVPADPTAGDGTLKISFFYYELVA